MAPGARLIIGKVCNDSGLCPDSAVIAGMQWAAANGAKVVSMSLGGAPDDGTYPTSQAVNNLTAQHGALFVIAAGNSGPRARARRHGPSTSTRRRTLWSGSTKPPPSHSIRQPAGRGECAHG